MTNALTPRHEAPADDDDGPCTCCDDTGITIQTERPCACSAGIPFEAPAEGAGEVTADSLRSVSDETMRALLSCKDVGSGRAHLASIINDLRARSSAPEARDAS